MSCFLIVCQSLNIETSVEAFVSVVQVKKYDGSFNLSARGYNKLLGQIAPEIKN